MFGQRDAFAFPSDHAATSERSASTLIFVDQSVEEHSRRAECGDEDQDYEDLRGSKKELPVSVVAKLT